MAMALLFTLLIFQEKNDIKMNQSNFETHTKTCFSKQHKPMQIWRGNFQFPQIWFQLFRIERTKSIFDNIFNLFVYNSYDWVIIRYIQVEIGISNNTSDLI